MDDYAGRVLADRYRLPLPPSDAFELVETRAFDTYSGQEVLVRQIPLPEIVDAEVLGDEDPNESGRPVGAGAGHGVGGGHGEVFGAGGLTGQGPGDPAVRRALVAATAAAQLPDHPRLDQVFHVFVEAGSLWIISELVSARPLAALLAERTLSPHRAAEVAADVLTALRALHAQGWTHRNITARTVLICDDGRAMLTGLAAGAAEEALCGHDPVPVGPAGAGQGAGGGSAGQAGPQPGAATGGRAAIATPRAGEAPPRQTGAAPTGSPYPRLPDQPTPRQGPVGGGGAAPATGEAGTVGIPAQEGPVYRDQGASSGYAPSGGGMPGTNRAGGRERDVAPDDRAPRAGAIAAYRAGARAAAARAAAESTPRPSTGSSTWGEVTAVGGAAASSDPPWTSDPPVGRPGPSGPPGTGGLGGAGKPVPAQNGPERGTGGWARSAAPGGALAAERARQARMVVVGAVTERWAPEQAHPVQESWQLAPPVGPAADLWALGVLLFRAVQGHAPYPEESAAELVQLVCAEPPAYAEECGALRPVVESLMRKDPTERPECEELRGWLRSLIRSAPEPDLGSRTVTVPSIGASLPTDPRRLPLIRRRGELVRRRRSRALSASGALDPASVHGRHKKSAGKQPADEPGEWDEAAPGGRPAADHGDDRAASQGKDRSLGSTGRTRERRGGAQRSPRHLGRLLLGLILLLLAGAVLYALLFMPRADESADRGQADRTGTAGLRSAVPNQPGTNGRSAQSDHSGTQEARTTEPHGVAKGYTLRQDPKGFSLAVAEDWQRRGENDRDQVVYVGGDYELIVVPGRDKVSEFGGDPLAYQQGKEPELEPYRSSSWSGASGLRRNDVGGRAMAEGTFNWNDSSGRQVYVRNAAMILAGRYHVVQVIGPMEEQRSVDGFFDQARSTYRFTG
ncbi:protein kinase [Streptomyces syringium]|uniref:protein kinase n=1 Tax=Streptomyces syringium TaxID=76729 RepID=UPI00340D75B0